jgi:hypothetical protein
MILKNLFAGLFALLVIAIGTQKHNYNINGSWACANIPTM